MKDVIDQFSDGMREMSDSIRQGIKDRFNSMANLSRMSKGLRYGPRVPKAAPGRILSNGTIKHNGTKSRLRAMRRKGIMSARQQRKAIKATRRQRNIANGP